MAGIVRSLGREGLLPMLRWIRILVFGIHCGLLIALSTKLFYDSRPGVAAAILCIALPLYAEEDTLYWEALYAATGGMAWIVFSWDRIRRFRWGSLAVGVWAGVLLLLSPALVAIVVPVVIFRSANFKSILSVAMGMAVVCLPWAIRNEIAVGSFGLRDNFGLELYLSNSPGAQATMLGNWEHGLIKHPARDLDAMLQMRAMGEGRYYAIHAAMAYAWFRNHPGDFLRLTAARIWYFASPPSRGIRRFAYSVSLVTVLSIFGAALLFRRDRRTFFLLASMVAIYAPVYAVIQSTIRYRYPILWVSELLAGVALVFGATSILRTRQLAAHSRWARTSPSEEIVKHI